MPQPEMPEGPNPVRAGLFEELKIRNRDMKKRFETKPTMKVYPSARSELTKFCLLYESYDEIKLRLFDSIIKIEDTYYLVVGTDILRGEISLALQDATGKVREETFNSFENAPDFRTPPPKYIRFDGTVYWACRAPARVYQQGLTIRNISLFGLVTDAMQSAKNIRFNGNSRQLLTLLSHKPENKKNIKQRGISILSDNLASYVYNEFGVDEKKVVLNYRGRYLGILDQKGVKLHYERDYTSPWIERELAQHKLFIR